MVRVASVLPPGVESAFQTRCPTLDVLPVAPADFAIGVRDATILLTAQSAMRDVAHRPPGWPFGLRWVHLLSSGLDSYPDWLFADLAVTHSPGISAAPVAEYCLAAIFAAAKRMPELWINRAEEWRHSQLGLVAGQTLGIVGFGEIGKTLAARASALGMTVQAVRRSPAPLAPGIRRADSIEALFATSDHIVLALAATPETRGLINAEVLALARPGSHLINVARGSVLDQQALLAALDDGRISRASLDVTDPEPLPDGHPLYRHPRVFLSPHVAANDERLVERLADLFAENARRFLAKEPLLHPARPRQTMEIIP